MIYGHDQENGAPESLDGGHSTNNTLPDVVPKVLFSTALAGGTEHIDFDYSTFYNLARGAGMSDDQITEYTIDFQNDTNQKLSDMKGLYEQRKKRARIFVVGLQSNSFLGGTRHTDQEDLNVTVLHETGHHVNHLGKKEGELRLKACVWLLKISAISSIVALETLGYDAITRSITDPIMTGISMVTAGACLSLWGETFMSGEHEDHAWEKPAVAFAAAHQDAKIVSYTAKPLPKLRPTTS